MPVVAGDFTTGGTMLYEDMTAAEARALADWEAIQVRRELSDEEEAALTARVVAELMDSEPHKGGWNCLCGEWVDRETVESHAATCQPMRREWEGAV